MADKPKITFSTNPNARNRALIDGLIPIDGYDLEYVGDKYSRRRDSLSIYAG